MAAAKLLLLYAIGKPADPVDPDRLDLDEFKLLEANPTQSETARAAIDGLAATIGRLYLDEQKRRVEKK